MAQEAAEENHDESLVGSYSLPDPLVTSNGKRVTDARTWTEKRRPEILKLFETNMHGRTPAKRLPGITSKVTSVDVHALSDKAVRKEVTLFFSDQKDGPRMDLLIYLPKGAAKPSPMFLGLNFGGNQTVTKEAGIALSHAWLRENPAVVNHHATEASRGMAAENWQVEKLIARGYGLATACYNDLAPDYVGGFPYGVHPLFYKRGQTKPAPDEWGTIGAWAWGLSRALDYLETDQDVDARRVAVVGLSRLGKTALWAGAQDTRFALVISTDSGEGGAKLSRRRFGATIGLVNTSFPHWFCTNYKQFTQNVNALPVDAHMLIALVAPRPVYIASASEDLHSDPKGEFLAAKGADPVYRLLGTDGLGVTEMPPIHQPVMTTIGYHIRAGKHDMTAYDWDQYLTFADKHMTGK